MKRLETEVGRGFVSRCEIRSSKTELIKFNDKSTGELKSMEINIYGAEFVETGEQVLLRDPKDREGNFVVKPEDFPRGCVVLVGISELVGGGQKALAARVTWMEIEEPGGTAPGPLKGK